MPGPVAIAAYPTRADTAPLGPIWLAMRGPEAVAVGWDGEASLRQELRARGLATVDVAPDAPEVAPLRSALDAYFSGAEPVLPPLCRDGLSPFTAEVLAVLATIPRGSVTSYGGLAKAMGRDRGSARAIGGAVGRNPLPILWPCHRVLASDGGIGGFSGGLPRKRWLLRFESISWRAAPEQPPLPGGFG